MDVIQIQGAILNGKELAISNPISIIRQRFLRVIRMARNLE